jgi:pteridine reductase
LNLRGVTALVTGAGKRVGRAIAEELGRAGARVVVHHHASAEGAAEVVGALRAAGGEAVAIAADLRDAAACERLVKDARAALGPIQVLVSSAAGFERAPFDELDDARWDAMLALNVIAPARLARLVLPDMRAAGAGVIVHLLDVAAIGVWKHHAHYAASKAALLSLTRSLAAELAPIVRVVGVAPGTVEFPESYDEAARRAVTAKIPLGRTGAPGDVASAVRFLVEADFVTGVVLPVDGGRLVGGGGLL